jgi:hypothetical protein
MNDELKGFGRTLCGAIVVFFWYMPGKSDENYENLSQGSWCSN